MSLGERLGYAEDHDDRAAVLFRQGREAIKQGDYSLACSEFEQSEQLEPAPGTALNLAVCEERVGHLIRARSLIGLFLSSAKADDARKEPAAQLAADLDSRIPHLVIQIEPSAVFGTQVVVDEHALPLAPTQPLAIDPGPHTVSVLIPGYVEQRITTKVEQGQVVWKRFAMEPKLTTTPPRKAALPRNPRPRLPPLFYGALGVGIAGTLTAVASGLFVVAARAKVEDHCADKLCDPEGLSAARRGRAFTTVNSIAWPFALAGTSLAAYLFLTRNPHPRNWATLSFSVSATQASLTIEGVL